MTEEKGRKSQKSIKKRIKTEKMVIFKKGFVFVTCRIYLLCSVCNSLVQILVQNLVENLKPVQINFAFFSMHKCIILRPPVFLKAFIFRRKKLLFKVCDLYSKHNFTACQRKV